MNIYLARIKNPALLAVILLGGIIASAFPEGKEEIRPYPDAMTGQTAPAFSIQGLYGETYDSSTLKNSPVALIFGTSW